MLPNATFTEEVITASPELRIAAAREELSQIETEVAHRRRLIDFVPPVFYPLLKPARNKGAYGGRGSGKSHFFAELAIEKCRQRRTRMVCVREYQVSLEQSVKRLLEDKIQARGLGRYFHVMNNQIEVFNGGVIIFQGMNNTTADSIKSLEGYDVSWVEEAQSLSKRSLDLLRPTIRKPGSELWFSWNPEQPSDPVNEYFRGGTAPPDSVLVRATYEDNPFFPAVLRAEMEFDKARDNDKYEHIWLGEYEKHSESRVLKNWKIEEFDTPNDAEFYLGADWGYSVDPSVLVRCFISGRRLYIDHEVYRIGCEIDELPTLFDKIPHAREWNITADSARPETISYMQRHGYPNIQKSVKGKDSVKDGVIFLQSYDIVVHPRCVHTIDELRNYRYKTDRLTGRVLPIIDDKKNHVIDSLRYAVEAVRRAPSNVAPQGVGEDEDTGITPSAWGSL